MTKVSPSSKLLKIGTRGSPLALVQARQVASALEALSAGALATELVTFTTTGDQLTTERLINSGGKGLFTKELDIALDDGRIDLAVHSLKDVPVDLPQGQIFAAFPTREDPREAFMSSLCGHPRDLPKGATVGTASLRREAQTLAMRPDLKIKTFRGSVQTRMRKLSEGMADATYLAMAGLSRLNLANEGTPIPIEDMLPAACQGIIGVVTRKAGVPRIARDALARLDDVDARVAATAERAFLAALDGSCRTPIAAHLFREADCWRLKGEVLSTDGAQVWRAQETCPSGANDAALADLGRCVADNIREAAGDDLPAFVDE